MQDVVALMIEKEGRKVGFLTWGRVFDSVDPKQLIQAVKSGVSFFGFRTEVEITICDSLQEVSSCKYFFEGLLALSSKPIPFGKKSYPVWEKKMRRLIPKGKEIYFIGEMRQP